MVEGKNLAIERAKRRNAQPTGAQAKAVSALKPGDNISHEFKLGGHYHGAKPLSGNGLMPL